MKKKILLVSLLLAFILAVTACSEGTVSGKTEIYSDKSGVKTVTVRVWGDQEPLEGRDYTAGNNTAFMLSQGDDLVEKLYEFCELKDDVTMSFTAGASNKESTYITMRFTFTDIDDYNRKGRIIAGKNASEWVDATLTADGDTVTFSEPANNLKLLYLDILEKYFNDFDCYPIYEYGPRTQSQIIPDGIQFEGDDLYAFTWWIVPAQNEVVIGEGHAEQTYFVPAEDYEYRADLSGESISATGKGAMAPTAVSMELVDPQTEYSVGDSFVPFKAIVTYSDGYKATIDVTADMVTGFESDKNGAATVTVTYKTLSASYDIQLTGGTTPLDFPVWAWFIIGFVALLLVSLILTFYNARKEKKNAKK